MNETEKPMSKAEAAEYLGIALSTLTKWVSAGIVKVHKPGLGRGKNQKVFFLKSELIEMVKEA